MLLTHVGVLPHLTTTDFSRAFWVHFTYIHIARGLKSELEYIFLDMAGCEDTLEVVRFMMSIYSPRRQLYSPSKCILYARSPCSDTFILRSR